MVYSRKVKILSIIALVIAIAGMSLGFAAFSMSLNISSTASVSPSSSNFAVKFSTVSDRVVEGAVTNVVTDGNGSGAYNGAISNDGLPVFGAGIVALGRPGNFVEYTIYALNVGEYDAYLNNINYIGEKNCSVAKDSSTSLIQNVCDYINVSVSIDGVEFNETTGLNGKVLEKGKSSVVVIRIEYDENGPYVDEELVVSFPSITLVYSSVDDSSMSGKIVRVIKGDVNTSGSLVGIGNEGFYTIGVQGDNLYLLAYNNLNVGNIVEGVVDSELVVKPLSNPTGVQSPYAYGARIGSDDQAQFPWVGVVAYSDVGTSYETSIVKGYVDNYRNYLESLGVNVVDARLVTYDEISLVCNLKSESCNKETSWVYDTSFWTQASYEDTNRLHVVLSNGHFDTVEYYINAYFGVRPVIVIPLSEF